MLLRETETQAVQIDSEDKEYFDSAAYADEIFYLDQSRETISPALLSSIQAFIAHKPKEAKQLASEYVLESKHHLVARLKPNDLKFTARILFLSLLLDPQLEPIIKEMLMSDDPQTKDIYKQIFQFTIVPTETLIDVVKDPQRRIFLKIIGLTSASAITGGILLKTNPVFLKTLSSFFTQKETVKPIVPIKQVSVENPIPKQVELVNLEIPEEYRKIPSLEFTFEPTNDFDPDGTLQIVKSVYNPDSFYLEDGETINPELKSLVKQFANSSDESVKIQAQDLAMWYLQQMETSVTQERDLKLSLRMADLASLLEPKLIPIIEQKIPGLVTKHQTLLKQEQQLAQQQVQTVVDADKVVIDQRIFEKPNPKTNNLPPSLFPFVSSFLISPQIFAAYFHSQLSVAREIASTGANAQDWTASKVEPINIAVSNGLIKLISPKISAALAQLPSIIFNQLNIVHFTQDNCSSVTSPCEATAIVFGDLIKQGQSFRITTFGEILRLGETTGNVYKKIIKFN